MQHVDEILDLTVPTPDADCIDLYRLAAEGMETLTTRQERDYWHCRASSFELQARGWEGLAEGWRLEALWYDDRFDTVVGYGIIGVIIGVLFAGFTIHYLLNRSRYDRFVARQLQALLQAVTALDAHAVAKTQATIEHAHAEAQLPLDRLWVRRGPSLTWAEVTAAGQQAQTYVEETLKPARALAHRDEELRQNIRYETAAFVREVKKLAILNQQARWEQAVQEITQLRRVLEAAVSELVHNPALEGRLDYILQRLVQFSGFMEQARAEAKIDDGALGELADEMLTRAFEADVDRMLGGSQPTGASRAHAGH